MRRSAAALALATCLMLEGGTGAAQSAGWSTAALGEARAGAAVATVGTKALFAGGCSSSCGYPNAWKSSAYVDVYDSATGDWSAATLSVPRRFVVAATLGSQVLFAGGSVFSGKWTTAVDIYDDQSAGWSTARLSEQRCCFSAGTVDSTVLFAGGDVDMGDGFRHPSATVDLYDSRRRAWSTARLSRAGPYPSMASIGNKLFIAAGGGLVDIYDAANGTWSTAPLHDARDDAVLATVGNQVLVIGGRSITGTAEHFFDIVDVYDETARTWSTARLSKARAGPKVAVVGTFAVIAGGASGATAVDIYNSATGHWSTASMSTERSAPVVAVAGPQVLLTCTSDCRTPGDVDIYDTATGDLSTAALPSGGYPIAVSAGSEALFIGAQSVDIYDSQTGTWSTMALSPARYQPNVAVVGTQVLIAGAEGDGGVAVDIYDRSAAELPPASTDAE